MQDEKYNRVSISEMSKYAEPFVIQNFILSDNVTSPPDFLFKDSYIFDGIMLGLSIKGTGKLRVNFREYELFPNTVLLIFPHQIIKIIEASDDFLIETLFISFDFYSEFPMPKDLDAIMQIGKTPCLVVSQEIMQNLLEYHAFIVKQYNNIGHIYREKIVKTLLYALMIEVSAIYKSDKKNTVVKNSSRQEELVNRFFELLMKHYQQERNVSFYADKLCLTSKYLSSTIKKVTGQSILSWIHETVVIEAKMLLRSTTLTVQQVSDKLNFPNPSFFSRFFKGYAGMTPLEYRNQ